MGEDGGSGASHKPVFGASIAAVQACDAELVGAVGSQIGNESFGHAGIYVHFLPVVFDLWWEEIKDGLLKDRGEGPQVKECL